MRRRLGKVEDGGKIRGQRQWKHNKTKATDPPELVEGQLGHRSRQTITMPSEVLGPGD